MIDWSVLRDSLSRSADGSTFQISTNDPAFGTLDVGYPALSPNLGLRNISAAVGFPDPHGGVEPRDFNGATPSFSPDGRWLAFTVGECSAPPCAHCRTNCLAEHVYVARAEDGAFAHEVASDGMSPSWSGDGKWLAYAGYVGTFSDGHRTGIYVVRRDGKLRKKLSGGSPDFAPATDSPPVFAPRGNLIAYVCGTVARQICVVDKDGSHRRALALGEGVKGVEEFEFAWSRDGQQIAYTAIGPGDGRPPNDFARLFVVDVHGGSPKRILRQAGLGAPVDWSPDNRRIAYLATPTPDDIVDSVYVATLSSRRSTLLTTDLVSPSDVRWASDSTLTYITLIPR